MFYSVLFVISNGVNTNNINFNKYFRIPNKHFIVFYSVAVSPAGRDVTADYSWPVCVPKAFGTGRRLCLPERTRSQVGAGRPQDRCWTAILC